MNTNLTGKDLQRFISRKREQVITKLEDARKGYADKWIADESAFADGDHYIWMASLLSEYQRVLEIGVGNGSSTLALVKTGHFVIGVDENPACVKRAERRLMDSGFKVKTLFRGEIKPTPKEDTYELKYSKVTHQIAEEQVLLIEGCVPYDERLLGWLEGQTPFDAVACWLIGTHDARHADVNVNKDNISSPHLYRLSVQNPLFVRASKLLRPGGVLHIIDRGKPDGAEQILSARQDQASPTPLLVESSPQIRVYQGPDSGMKMCQMFDGENIKPISTERIAFISTICRVPG